MKFQKKSRKYVKSGKTVCSLKTKMAVAFRKLLGYLTYHQYQPFSSFSYFPVYHICTKIQDGAIFLGNLSWHYSFPSSFLLKRNFFQKKIGLKSFFKNPSKYGQLSFTPWTIALDPRKRFSMLYRSLFLTDYFQR